MIRIFVVVIFVLGCLSHFSFATNFNTSVPQQGTNQTSSKINFKCSNGDSILSQNVCDGQKDCSDGSDETFTACQPMNIRCPNLSFKCTYGACISDELRCDGHRDCADGSDEQGCTSTNGSCGSRSFQCISGQCIDKYGICDGVKDCTDGTDETFNLCRNFMCPINSFRCRYGACMDKSVKCNGQVDCSDKSDEMGCSDNTGSTSPYGGYSAQANLDYSSGLAPPTGINCWLPPHPKHGSYTSPRCSPDDQIVACSNTQGSAVPNTWIIKYSCNDNYELSSRDSPYSVCENGNWNNPLDCVRMCPPLRSLSVDVECSFNGQEVSCDKPMKPGTTAIAKCKVHYKELYRPESSTLKCKENGEWNYKLFYCTPDTSPHPPVNVIVLVLTPELLDQYFPEIDVRREQ